MTLPVKVRQRRMAMLNAFLIYNARKLDRTAREHESRAYLLLWARLGGVESEAIRDIRLGE